MLSKRDSTQPIRMSQKAYKPIILYSDIEGSPSDRVVIDGYEASHYDFYELFTSPSFSEYPSTDEHPIRLFTYKQLLAVKDYVEKGNTKGYNKELFSFFGLFPEWLKLGDTMDFLPTQYMKFRLEEAWILLRPETKRSLVLLAPPKDLKDATTVTGGEAVDAYKGFEVPLIDEPLDWATVGQRSELLINSTDPIALGEDPNTTEGIAQSYADRIKRLGYIAEIPNMRGTKQLGIKEFHFFIVGSHPSMSDIILEIESLFTTDRPSFLDSLYITNDVIILHHRHEMLNVRFYIHRITFPSLSHLLAATAIDSQCFVNWRDCSFVSDRYMYSMIFLYNYFIRLPFHDIGMQINEAKLEVIDGIDLRIPEIDPAKVDYKYLTYQRINQDKFTIEIPKDGLLLAELYQPDNLRKMNKLVREYKWDEIPKIEFNLNSVRGRDVMKRVLEKNTHMLTLRRYDQSPYPLGPFLYNMTP